MTIFHIYFEDSPAQWREARLNEFFSPCLPIVKFVIWGRVGGEGWHEMEGTAWGTVALEREISVSFTLHFLYSRQSFVSFKRG